MTDSVVFEYGSLNVGNLRFPLTGKTDQEPDLRVEGVPFYLKEPERINELASLLGATSGQQIKIYDTQGKELNMSLNSGSLRAVA